MSFDRKEYARKYYLANLADYKRRAKERLERVRAERAASRVHIPVLTKKEKLKRKAQIGKIRRQGYAANPTDNFYVGTSCSKGHDGRRYVNTGSCITCMAEHQKARIKKDPERQKAMVKRWAERNVEKRREIGRSAYKRNPEKARLKNARRYRENPGKFNAIVAKRKTAQMRRTPPWADFCAIKEIYVKAGQMRKATGIKYVVDHIIPLRGELVSGLHVHENLQIMENVANIKKKNHFVVE